MSIAMLVRVQELEQRVEVLEKLIQTLTAEPKQKETPDEKPKRSYNRRNPGENPG